MNFNNKRNEYQTLSKWRKQKINFDKIIPSSVIDRTSITKVRENAYFLFSLLILFLGFQAVFFSMDLIENRTGTILFDPIHEILPPPVDLSFWVFGMMYLALFMTIVDCYKIHITWLATAFISYGCLIFLRSIVIYLIALNPPSDMILLEDPLVSFFSSENIIYTKDLFFSGHTASIVYFYLLVRTPWVKRLILTMGIFIICALIFQRVHYTIDILGGIFAAYAIYWIVCKLNLNVKS